MFGLSLVAELTDRYSDVAIPIKTRLAFFVSDGWIPDIRDLTGYEQIKAENVIKFMLAVIKYAWIDHAINFIFCAFFD